MEFACATVIPLPLRFGPPFSVKLIALKLKVDAVAALSRATVTEFTGVFLGFGVTGVMFCTIMGGLPSAHEVETTALPP